MLCECDGFYYVDILKASSTGTDFHFVLQPERYCLCLVLCKS